jgi:hypothetical protein|tara:strand:- start:798 stop:1028 length:231 start_codon:yes stop_codon:yes gene_type:complete
MVTLFNNNILPNYRTQYEKVLYTSSKSSLDKIVSDYYEEKAKRSEIIMDKYKRLSSEYQTQAKEFKKTHEEIKESE